MTQEDALGILALLGFFALIASIITTLESCSKRIRWGSYALTLLLLGPPLADVYCKAILG